MRVHMHVVEGPYPIDGTWSFEPNGEGTRVHFVAEGELRGMMRVLLVGREPPDASITL